MEKLQRIADLTRHLGRASRLDQVYDAALDALHDTLGVGRASILLFDERASMQFVAARGISAGYRKAVAGHSPWTPDSQDAVPFIVADVLLEASLDKYRDTFASEGIRALGFFPLIYRDRVIGKFMLYYAEPRELTAEEMAIGEIVAAQVAFGIARLRAEAETQKTSDLYRLQSERLDTLISSVPGVVWEAYGQPDTAAQRIDFVSRYVETMLDYTVDEWLSTPNFWLHLVHPDDRDAAARTSAEGFRSGAAHTNEFRWVAKDGRAVWCAAYSIAVKDERGVPVGMRGVTMDISDRKRAEESLRFLLKASEALAETLETAAAIDAVLKMSVPLLGDTAAADIEQEDGSIRRIGASPLDESAAAAEWRKGSVAVQRGTVIVPLIARGRVIGGMSFTRPRAYAESEVQLIELLAKRAAVAIDNARLYQEARAANKAKDEFLASLSHELRTPMTATLGWVSLMRMTDFDRDQTRDAMDAIEQGTRTQARLIEDLLDISRIVSGKVEMYHELVDLAAVVQQAMETTLPAARAKQIRLDLGAPPEPVTLWGDGGRIKQVIWNLLSNAVKFTPPGGEVRIEIAREDSAARVRVSDSGEGISADFLPRVFERFQQGSTGTNRRHGGLGLGLAIARSFVELHGGSIDAASEGAGKGATFTVSLPAGAAAVVRGRAQASAPPAAAPRS